MLLTPSLRVCALAKKACFRLCINCTIFQGHFYVFCRLAIFLKSAIISLRNKNKGVYKMIISLILIALFIILLPFCPLWAGCRNEKGNVDILHIHLWSFVLHRLFAKNSREKLQVLSYRQVIEMYNHRIKE